MLIRHVAYPTSFDARRRNVVEFRFLGAPSWRSMVKQSADNPAVPSRTDLSSGGSARSRRCERRRPPVPRSDGDQGFEQGRLRCKAAASVKVSGRPQPSADQCTLPAIILQRLRMARQCLQAIVIFDDAIAAMAGPDLVGDVPKKLGFAAHAICWRGMLPKSEGRH